MASKIVRAAIHPAIGVARLGTSPDEYLLAPRVPHPPPRSPGSSHDASGRLKREAAEFRVYGYDADGNVVAELTVENADITWTVHVANAKAAWFKFRCAMDVDTLADTCVLRRNPRIVDPSERRRLVIDPGPRSVSGRGKGGSARERFDTGMFKGIPVYLGELRTTDVGRLLFLGGHGVSSSPSGAPPYVPSDADPFGNAEDWHDDIADGPVDATVRVNGVDIPTEGAWVVSAPPNYAPDLKSWRSLYDLMVDLYVSAGWMPSKNPVSFTQDVYPVLSRLSGLQWVNQAFSAVFGHNAPFDFLSSSMIERISHSQGGDVFKPLRKAVLDIFREQTSGPSDPAAWPWLYGDSFGTSPASDPYQNLALGGERLRYLEAWCDGRFVADWGGSPVPPDTIDGYPVAEQPAALDRAALEFCAADAFHPGIELTWPMRHLSMYSKPFRIARATAPEPDQGSHLSVRKALGPEGPLHGQFPGSLSRWMLVPWQVDTGGCLAGYDEKLKFDAPSFWPSRVPNNVLAHGDYRRAVDTSLSEGERTSAFVTRRSWFFPLGAPSTEWGKRMIWEFGHMGVLEAYPGLEGDPQVPSTVYAETLPNVGGQVATATAGSFWASGERATDVDQRARALGFADEADRIAMRRMRFGR